MATGFTNFGALHFAILGGSVALPWVLSRFAPVRPVRIALGVALAVNEVVWYAYRFFVEGWRLPQGLPLQLCDASVWLTAWAAIAASPRAFELAYYWGLAGAGMALITPDLWAPCWSYPTLYFWTAHCGIVVILLLMIWGGVARPRCGSMWRAFIAANVFGLATGLFNLAFKTNYMYLCRKPVASSLLDVLGPWPWYLLAGEGAALLLFWLLWLPFRR